MHTGMAAGVNCPTMANKAVVSSDNDSNPDNDSSRPIPIAVRCDPEVSVYNGTIANGQTKTCTITNRDVRPAPLTFCSKSTVTALPARPAASRTTRESTTS
jgi:hypothetical protein